MTEIEGSPNPHENYDSLSGVYEQLPVIRELDRTSGFEKRGIKRGDGSILEMERNEEGTLDVTSGYTGSGEKLQFILDAIGLRSIHSTFATRIGGVTVTTSKIQLPGTGVLSDSDIAKDPSLNKIATALVNYVGQLASSDTLIQPPFESLLRE